MAPPTDPRPGLLGLSDGRAAWLALGAWVAFAVVMGGIVARSVARDPTDQVSNHVYEQASRAWAHRESLYQPFNDRGFLYLPQAALLYAPFAEGDPVLRHVAVRTVFALWMLVGVVALARVGDPRRRGTRFLLLSLTALPLCVQSMRQGQINLPMTGALLLATAALATGRLGAAAAALALALGWKPLAIVLLLLAAACAPWRLGGRLALALGVLGALPFLTAPPAYVAGQYVEFGQKLVHAGAPPTMYYDLRGLLDTGFGVVLPAPVLTALRAAAGLAVLALALWTRRRRGPEASAPALYALAACYLMLFNPKTEDPTYVVLGPAVGLALVAAWEAGRPRLEQALLAAFPLPIALAYELFGGRRVYWFRPALAAAFTAYVVWRVVVDARPVRGERAPAPR